MYSVYWTAIAPTAITELQRGAGTLDARVARRSRSRYIQSVGAAHVVTSLPKCGRTLYCMASALDSSLKAQRGPVGLGTDSTERSLILWEHGSRIHLSVAGPPEPTTQILGCGNMLVRIKHKSIVGLL